MLLRRLLITFVVSYVGTLSTMVLAATGDLDTSFGGGQGWVSTGFPGVHGVDQSRLIIQQADGKLVAAGYSNNGSNNDFALVRYNSDNSLDTTFNGTGKVTTAAIDTSNDYVYSMIQQADGKLVAAGSSDIGVGNNDVAFLVRYNSDGSLDTTFNGTGKVTTAVGTSDYVAYSVIQQVDGKLVITGSSNNDFALVRYNADGSLDTAFNGTGKVVTTIAALTIDTAYSVIQQADGKLVAAGGSIDFSGNGNDFALVRYNADGTLDTTFDSDGKLTTVISASWDSILSVIQQSDGKLVAAGSGGNNADFALARYNTDGTLDNSFNGTGKVITSIGATTSDVADSVIQQSDGKLVAAGSRYIAGDSDFALVRYNSDGALDTTFDTDGKVTTAFGPGDAGRVRSVIQQSDGKLVATGDSSYSDFTLVRYSSNGSLDNTFDTDGKVLTNIAETSSAVAYSLIQQADGKLVTAGYREGSNYNYDFALVRYNADGLLDSTFDGDGKLTTAIGASNEEARSVIQQSDGKLVAVGYSHNGSYNNFALVRYNSNGSLDSTFDSDGKLTTAIGASGDLAESVMQQSDGKLLVAGRGGNADFVLVRYNSNGTLDTTFDGDGKLTTAIGVASDAAYSIIQQVDGKLVAAGTSENGGYIDFALVRYNADGTLDSTFNGTGKVTATIGASSYSDAHSVIQQADGKLVLAGMSNYGGGQKFALLRYNSDGSLDSTFDGDGKMTTAINNSRAYSVIQQADGKLVAMGKSDNNAALARYNSDGSLDTSFNSTGIVIKSFGLNTAANVNSGIQQSDGKLVVAGGSVGMPTGVEFSVARIESGMCYPPQYWNGSVCVDADAGSFVATIGATTQTPCPVGTNSFAGATICFPDLDGDTVTDSSDNCFLITNTNQLNMDVDAYGDACDGDIDGDGVPNGIDADPLSAFNAAEIVLPLDATSKGAKLNNSMRR